MLGQLNIKNFAIIDQLSVDFSGDLNILSGETGAGKSIIINAVNLILGERASPGLVRTGADNATVEALFQLPEKSDISSCLEDMGIPFRREVLIKRDISKKGKSRAWINGSTATLQMLSALAPRLISISGQNEHQLALKPENHIFLLDDFGGLTGERLRLNGLYRECCDLRDRVGQIRDILVREREREELNQFQLKEIEEANLVPGEEEELEREMARLTHAERLMDIAFQGYQSLYEKEDSVLSALGGLGKDLERGRDIDPNLENYRAQLESARLQLEDLALQLRDFYSGLELDPNRLEQVEERLHLIGRLKKKYGGSIEEILSFKEGLSSKSDQILQKKEELADLGSLLEEKKCKFISLAQGLSSKRQEIAGNFETKVEDELGLLNMGGTRFKVDFRCWGPENPDVFDPGIDEGGIDDIEFMISPNLGEDLRPLAKIASGGELSRIMLAMKTVLARTQPVETLVFDEIDSGIGGATAAKVGEKLADLSGYHQILCITHLPQIASYGGTHFLVQKKVSGGRTRTSISLLDRENRVREIARLLGGKAESEKTVAHAREMLS